MEEKIKNKDSEISDLKKKVSKQNENIEEIRDDLAKEMSKKEAYENKLK